MPGKHISYGVSQDVESRDVTVSRPRPDRLIKASHGRLKTETVDVKTDSRLAIPVLTAERQKEHKDHCVNNGMKVS